MTSLLFSWIQQKIHGGPDETPPPPPYTPPPIPEPTPQPKDPGNAPGDSSAAKAEEKRRILAQQPKPTQTIYTGPQGTGDNAPAKKRLLGSGTGKTLTGE